MLDTLTDEQRAEEDAVDDELLQRRLDLDVELVLLGELLLGAPDGAQNTAAARLRGHSVSTWSDRLQSRWIKVGVAMYLQSTFMNLTLCKFKLHKPLNQL